MGLLALTLTPKMTPDNLGSTVTLLAPEFAINRFPAESKPKPAGSFNPTDIRVVKTFAVAVTPNIVPETLGSTVMVLVPEFAVKRFPAESNAIPHGEFSDSTFVGSATLANELVGAEDMPIATTIVATVPKVMTGLHALCALPLDTTRVTPQFICAQ